MSTSTADAGRSVVEKRRRYRRLFVGFVLAGVVVSVALRVMAYPLVGEAVYWVGIVAAMAVWLLPSIQLFDERDLALERRASHLTLLVAVPVLVVSASLVRVLPRVTELTIPPEVIGALYGYVGLFAVFGAVYLVLRYR